MNDLQLAGITSLARTSPSWDHDADVIHEIIAAHHRGVLTYDGIMPLEADDLRLLRAELARACPRLVELAQQMMRTLHAFGCGSFIERLGLSVLDPQRRALIVHALAVCIGEPTATDRKQRRVIWDVKPRQLGDDYFATFSEHDGEAAFHTDTQYYPMPERYFLLYVMQAASCGGGRSSVCDARALREQLDAPASRWVSQLLSENPLPFRVPSAFVTVEGTDMVQATIAPVLSDVPSIRYRRDTLIGGLQAFAQYDSPDVRRALDVFNDLLLSCSRTAEFVMPTDALLLIDNHHALHARSAFQDPLRHLLRIRVRGVEGDHERTRYPLLTRPIVRGWDIEQQIKCATTRAT